MTVIARPGSLVARESMRPGSPRFDTDYSDLPKLSTLERTPAAVEPSVK